VVQQLQVVLAAAAVQVAHHLVTARVPVEHQVKVMQAAMDTSLGKTMVQVVVGVPEASGATARQQQVVPAVWEHLVQ
jgi:hypothetical protein